ncbi:tetratricopeptide repeat protein, partial [Patiriisocius hiemis]
MKKILLVFVLTFSFFYSVSQQSIQQQIDSMLIVAEKVDDSTRLAILNRVGFHYVFNDLPKAQYYINKGLKEAQQKNIVYWEAAMNSTYGIYMDISGVSDSAKYYFEKSLDIATKNNIKTVEANVTNNLGMYHWNKKEYEDALKYFFSSLEKDRKNGIRKELTSSLSNIGLIYQEMGLYEKALKYHEDALTIRREEGLKNEIPISLNNIAEILKAKNNFKDALLYVEESLIVSEKQKVTREYLTALNIKGDILKQKNNHKEAILTFEEAIEKRNQLNIDRKANLDNIESLLEIYLENKDLKNASTYIKAGEKLIDEFPELENASFNFYKLAATTNYKSGNAEEGAAFFEKAFAAKDSIFSSKNAESIATLETKFKLSEKENKILQQRAQI